VFTFDLDAERAAQSSEEHVFSKAPRIDIYQGAASAHVDTVNAEVAMKILLAVDGSAFTDRVLDFVLTKGHWPGSENEFVVFHCVPPWPHRAAAFEKLDVVTRYYQEDAESVLEPVRRVIESSGVHAIYRHTVGAAAHAISEMAQREGFDLVVMGSHGHGALANVVLGSVTTAVLALCKTPVLVIR
jgi:nucleotide-binding universal stress UspA family protein